MSFRTEIYMIRKATRDLMPKLTSPTTFPFALCSLQSRYKTLRRLFIYLIKSRLFVPCNQN